MSVSEPTIHADQESNGPKGTQDSLKRLPDADQAQSLQTLTTLTHVDYGSAYSFQRDLFFYWSAARSAPLTLTRQDRLYRKDLRRVNNALLQPERIGLIAADHLRSETTWNEATLSRLIFIRLLLTDLGLLLRDRRLTGGAIIRAAEDPDFLDQELAERIARSFHCWRDGTFWNEILSIPGLTVNGVGSRTDPVPDQIVCARKSVLQQIAAQQPAFQEGINYRPTPDPSIGPWIAIEQLILRIRALDYNFLLPRDYSARMLRSTSAQAAAPRSIPEFNTYGGYLSLRSPYVSYGNAMGWTLGSFPEESAGWSVVEAGFIRAILIEPLLWMGLVDIGYIDTRPVAYRLTPIGAWMLGVGPAVQIPAQEGKVVVQPNFEIVALDPISDRALATLDEFAERTSAERAIKYRITRESVYRGQRRGWTATRIVDTLQSLMQGSPKQAADEIQPQAEMVARPSLPQNVTRTLEEWQRLYERVTIHRRARLLQATDTELLERLRQDPTIAAHLIDWTGEVEHRDVRREPTALVSPALGATEALVRALHNAGYPPARTRTLSGEASSAITPVQCLEIGSDGRLRFTIPLPSIFLLEQLMPFVDCTSQEGPLHTRYDLTQAAVERAIAGGMTIDQILTRLRTFYHGPLPHWLEIKVRAWGHYYGDAHVQSVALVQVRDRQVLDELLSEPEFKGILRRFQPMNQQALAVVRTQDLELLRELLAERGINIQDRPIDDLSEQLTED